MGSCHNRTSARPFSRSCVFKQLYTQQIQHHRGVLTGLQKQPGVGLVAILGTILKQQHWESGKYQQEDSLWRIAVDSGLCFLTVTPLPPPTHLEMTEQGAKDVV